MIQVTRQMVWPMLAFGIALATPAHAQAPSEAQRAAIKSNCRSDYMAHCSSIPPGGAASLQCLQQNMASLSAACAGAVKAVEVPAQPKAEQGAAPKEEQKGEAKTDAKGEPAPATSEPARTTAEPAAKAPAKGATVSAGKPSSAQIAAIRSNCRSDYPKVCAGVPTGGAPALQCLEKNKAKLSAACEKAVAAAGGGGAAASAASGGDAAATANANPNPDGAAPPRLILRQMMPREILFVLRSACGADVRSLCAGVPPGGGRIIECLATKSASLSPACQDVLGQFAAR